MSLLGDFNEICEAQDNSVEMKIHKYVTMDKDPIVCSMNKFMESYYVRSKFEPNLQLIDLLEPNKIYIISRPSYHAAVTSINGQVATDDKSSYMVGGKEEGLINLTSQELEVYLNSHEKYWVNDKTIVAEFRYKVWSSSLDYCYDMDTIG